MVLLFCLGIVLVSSVNEEGLSLLGFKASLHDPNNNLYNWDSSNLTPCNWTGVFCTGSVVTAVKLYQLNLSGTLAPTICDLPNLLELNLSKNFISGPIPDGFVDCGGLEILDLCTNRLHGPLLTTPIWKITTLRKLYLCENYMYDEVPVELGNLASLEELVIYSNNLTGRIPSSIRKLKQLRVVRAGLNALSGPIPAEISECESLEILGLAQNQLEGSIPRELQRLQNLTTILLWQNSLYGEIPPEIGNISSLELLALHQNSLSGSVPRELGKLSQLKRLYMYTNQLNGTIPSELGNCTNAVEIDLSENRLIGIIPKELGMISNLSLLHLFENNLQGHIPRELGQLSLLKNLDLSLNNLTGTIPLEFQNLTYMEDLQLFDNQLEGVIPPHLGAVRNLTILDISANNLVGSLPVELYELHNLTALELFQNRFSGIINPGIGQLRNLERLLLSANYFEGYLPPEIGNLAQLVTFNVSSNRFSGSIPHELGKCGRLQRLDLSRNHFTGMLPNEIGNLVNLELLKVSDNMLSGEIPGTLGNLIRLTDLELGGNRFSGNISFHLGKLMALQIALNLSHNKLSGSIPDSLGNLQMLESLYLNDNQLVGTVPDTTTFRKMDFTNFAGNNGLCRVGTNHCHPSVSPFHSAKHSWIRDEGFTYQDLLEATGNFSEDAVLGRGACGTVYKAVMSDGEVIAVKKLNSRGEGANNVDRSFLAEISTLGKIRHRNIVKLYGFCYHEDSNLLLYEYMENGSLGEQLHSSATTCALDWGSRYKIALGAAEGLCYLHYDCKPQIIHRDIKSNNILLDEVFQAHVGDFGLAKLIDFSYSKSMSAVAGSYGYIAPEYAYTMKVTEKCDIYSFGVVLLELVTGRSPVQPLEQGGDLVTCVRRAIQASVPTSELFDKRLNLSAQKTVEEMSLILKIALFCTSTSPLNRPTMREVIAMLIDAREYVSNSPTSPTSESPLDEDDAISSKG
uniref:LRR receptor-like serine/threonine-protein kinase RCH1 n=1 Tax=Cajanus cajan TaxID=3821 RepID=A0A151TDM9_CAJCA|nr:LRR receptor-like serine/threonine-protein kinase RCH1 [Cajanus cajan]